MTTPTLPAGPALDLLMAECMGLKCGHLHGDPDGPIVARLRPDAPAEYDRWRRFSPSSEIADAWEVVEHLRHGDCRWGFTLDSSSEKWTAIFYDQKCVGESTSAPHAICLAALRVAALAAVQ